MTWFNTFILQRPLSEGKRGLSSKSRVVSQGQAGAEIQDFQSPKPTQALYSIWQTRN